MDTTRSIYKLPIHEHPLLPSTQFTFSTCDGCHVRGFMYGYYFCNEASFTLHVQCVLGDFSRFKPNESITIMGDKCKAVLNNHSSRPFCRHCHERCKVSIIIKADGEQKNGCICSTSCLLSFFGITQ
ncbi:BnaCnng44600D [Brassica napus]|uniref:(rape) hypothetical protein n=1 Tax=Brassica napus TaxID=3708 RepID=A0A078JDH6_BRANA|nr:unnamed protein product [Brassica napus]CDY64704.1 BnaCnng44600D [Brassica napus]